MVLSLGIGIMTKVNKKKILHCIYCGTIHSRNTRTANGLFLWLEIGSGTECIGHWAVNDGKVKGIKSGFGIGVMEYLFAMLLI